MRTVSSLGFSCVVVVACVACGGSDDGGTGGTPTAAGAGAAGMTAAGTGGMGGGTAGTGGVPGMMMTTTVPPMMMMPMTTPGVGEEGNPCSTTMVNCNMGLSCSKLPEPFDGVCGRPCMMDTDCTMAGEVCGAYDEAGPGICLDLVGEWEVFRFLDTSACDLETFPVFVSDPDTMEQLPGGYCLRFCALDGTDPTTLPADVQMDISECAGNQDCNPDIVTFNDMLPLGVCAISAARGDDCGSGAVCSDMADGCAASDPTDINSSPKCLQDCTTGGMCASGTCTEVKDEMGMVLGSICVL